MTDWHMRPVPLKFGVGDRALFEHLLPLQVHAVQLGEVSDPVVSPQPPADPLLSGSQGFYLRALPIAASLPRLTRCGEWIRYVPMEYGHCYIDLAGGLEAYRAKFSSKTRSTINRKVRKFQEQSGGQIRWQVYDRPEDMAQYHALARQVSSRTYQERLLDAGIPDGPAFLEEVVQQARDGRVRGYIMFDADKPVAYLHCPVKGDAYIYAYLGYDPDYMKLSVGTVLQWLALEDIFGRPAARYFDFTEGQSDHKRLFATHDSLCANVMFVRASLRNRLWLHAHAKAEDASAALGRLAEYWGIKSRLRKLLRFGLARPDPA